LKICLLCYRGNPYSGGQGIYLKYVAEEMVRQGHTVHAIVGPPYPSHMRGVTVHPIHNNEYFVKKGRDIINPGSAFDILMPLNLYEYASTRLNAFSEISVFSLRAFQKLMELQRSERFDIIHDNQCLGYGLLLMKRLGIPVVATIHHPLTIDLKNVIERASSFKNKLKGAMFYPILMQQIVSRRLDHIVTVSEDSKRRNHTDLGVPLKKQTVVYNGLDASVFRPLSGVKKEKGAILFVGNVEDGKKGFPYLVKAMQCVRSGVTLTVVDGGSPHRRIAAALIKKLGVQHRIRFVGAASTEDLVCHYCRSEIAIVPSTHEGFGFPAAEAMACGTPVIASDGGALPEVVGDAGLIVPARDHEALAAAIEALVDDRARLKRYARMGISRVRTVFTWENAVSQMIDLYRRLT